MPALSPLRQRQRLVARLALYGAFVAIGLCGWAGFPALLAKVRPVIDRTWADPTLAARPEVERFRRLLAIDTTDDLGREVDGARYLAEELGAAGIESEIIAFPDGQANLIAIIEGKSREALVLHSHLDTVTVGDPAIWGKPPFAGIIEGPWIHGRGAFDMKSTTIAQLEVMLAVKERMGSGWLPERSLMLLATSGEETGSDLGTPWLLATRPALAERAWAVLTEGGVYEATNFETIKYWGISYGQKQQVHLWACATSRERLETLATDLMAHNGSAEPRLLPAILPFLADYASSRQDPVMRGTAQEPDLVLTSRWHLDVLPPYLRTLFVDEAEAYTIDNDADGGFRMRIVLYALPDRDWQEAAAERLAPWLLGGVALRLAEPVARPATSPLGHPAYVGLVDELRRRFPGAAIGSYYLGFSDNDGRFFRAAGIPTYGYFPFRAFSPDSFTMDSPAERIALHAFVEGVEIYRDTALRLLGAVDPGQ